METDDCVKMFIGLMMVVFLVKFAASLDEEKSDGPENYKREADPGGAVLYHYTRGYK